MSSFETVVADFVQEGMVVIPDALDPAFCEEVVMQRLDGIGVDPRNPGSWPTARQNLPWTTAYPIAEVAPEAAVALHALVGGPERIRFGDLPDNLIVNFPDPEATWWPPEQWDAPDAGWHKDGDWFRHFLDSPEQGLLGITFWRDVVERQGPTYVAADSIAPMAELLAAHPEGLHPTEVGTAVRDDVLPRCRDFRALTGRQGTVIFAHPFMVHTASVNALDRMRVISNTSVMMTEPLRFDRPASAQTAIERSTLAALGVDQLDYRPTGERGMVDSERQHRWKRASADAPGDN